MQVQVEKVIEILEHLSPERIAEAADFIEFLQQKDQENSLREDFASISEKRFSQVWENDEDAAYDAL